MKIAYKHQIFSAQRFGGISRYFVELAKNISLLKKNEDMVKIISPLHINNYLTNEINKVSIQGIRSPDFRGSSSVCSIVNSFFSPILIRNFEPDLIHETYYNSITKNTSRAKKIITVFDMVHEIFLEQFSKKDNTTEEKKIAIQEADHIICISENTQKDLVRILDVDINKTSVIHLGYSLSETKTKFQVKNDRPYLLYVGGRDGYKNFSRFVQAYANSKEIMNSFDIVMFGSKNFTNEEIKIFEKLNIRKENIKAVDGDDTKLANYYRNAELFVYPSLYEGFGIPPLEAMSYGCPVICSNTSSIPEIVGDAAILFDPYSLESISNSIETVLSNNELRSTLISKGFEQIRKFSWEKCAKETFDVYKKILQ